MFLRFDGKQIPPMAEAFEFSGRFLQRLSPVRAAGYKSRSGPVKMPKSDCGDPVSVWPSVLVAGAA